MTKDKQINADEVKDGFDLIEYPVDYLFKAMVKVDSMQVEALESSTSAEESLLALVTEHVSVQAILTTRTNRSRTGKFEAVSLRVRLSSRSELEAVYDALASAPQVVMTL